MSLIERYRLRYEQEKDANAQLLKMIASVPKVRRTDPKFKRALILASHLGACRLNWLDRMAAGGRKQVSWWPKSATLEGVKKRFKTVETKWIKYLSKLRDEDLDVDFEFPVSGGGKYRWNIEGQIMQLVGHAFYHRGQIAMLVDDLGGKTVDTDYLYWAFKQQPKRWKRLK